MTTTPNNPLRRSLAGLALAWPLLGRAATLRPMTEGPFYPPERWRDDWPDQDADLTRVRRNGQVLVARGEHLGLALRIVDSRQRPLDNLICEIWQCDVLTHYRHPNVPSSQPNDEGFQGFGASRSDSMGDLRLRTIRPVAYPGRTPHIHIKLRHASFGELTSQLFVQGEPANARDGLWRRLGPDGQQAMAMRLEPAPESSGLRWQVSHTLVLPA